MKSFHCPRPRIPTCTANYMDAFWEPLKMARMPVIEKRSVVWHHFQKLAKLFGEISFHSSSSEFCISWQQMCMSLFWRQSRAFWTYELSWVCLVGVYGLKVSRSLGWGRANLIILLQWTWYRGLILRVIWYKCLWWRFMCLYLYSWTSCWNTFSWTGQGFCFFWLLGLWRFECLQFWAWYNLDASIDFRVLWPHGNW